MGKQFTENVLSNAVAGAAVEAGKGVYKYANRKIRLSNEMKRIHEMLKCEVARLQALKEDNERAVRRQKTKATNDCYKFWLVSVMKTVDKVEMLETRYKKEKNMSLKFSVIHRAIYSEKLKMIYEEVHKLVEEGKFPVGFLVDKPPEAVLKLNAPSIQEFPTLLRSLEQTLDLLRNEDLRVIGIRGTVASENTAFMQNLNNHEEVAQMFELVMYVKVSIERSEENVQQYVARRLGMSLEGSIQRDEVASLISEELKNKKYLLLLDEVMEPINLHEIGIPDNEKGCKVVVANESQRVCHSMAEGLVYLNKAEDGIGQDR